MMLFSGFATVASAAGTSDKPAETSILLDGYPLKFPVAPLVTKGTTMVPFRAIAEALHIEVVWTAKTQTILATKSIGGQVIKVTLRHNDKRAAVNGKQVLLAVAPMSSNGTILVPLSFFSSQFGASVSWDGAARTVSIVSPPEKMYTTAFYAISSFAERKYITDFDAVSFGWARIDGGGNLTLTGKDFYWPKPSGDLTPEAIVDETAAGGTSPQLMVVATDGNGELTKLLEDESLRAKAIESMVGLAVEKHFQGITIDFEGLGLTGDLPAVQKSLNEFVQLLDESANSAHLKLTLALHPLNGSYKGYDYKVLAAHADELVIMAYDYSYEKGPEPLNLVDQAIQLALKEVPKERLLLGISMGSENAQTINGKIGLAKRYALKGIAVWRLGLIGDQTMKEMQKSIIMKS
jgi:hypothetical protein